MRENRSSTTDRYSQPNARPNVRCISHPFAIGHIRMKVPLQQVFGDTSSFLTLRSNCSMPWWLSTQLQFTHQPCDPFASASMSLRLQCCMKTRASIHLAIGLKGSLNFIGNLGIFSAMLTWKTFAPSVIATYRNFEYPTHTRESILILMIGNESVPYCWPREKMPTAFFRISRSCLSSSFSRLSRRSSSS